MKSWQQALKDGIVPGIVADVATMAVVAWLGRRDSGSAIAPINASSHALRGEEAADVERPTLRETLPGLVINAGAGLWWSAVFEKLFGEQTDRNGLPAALAGGATTAALAYLLDYRTLPKRLTPGWEERISGRSLFTALAVMGAGIAIGALLARRD